MKTRMNRKFLITLILSTMTCLSVMAFEPPVDEDDGDVDIPIVLICLNFPTCAM